MQGSSRRRRQLTLRDVSEAAGVSEMTVSRVLRGRGEVSQATREKVLEAVRRLGYVPNRIAGALASQRVNLIGVLVPSISNLVFPEVLTAIGEVFDPTPYQPLVGFTRYDPAREERALYEMLSWRPAGLIVSGLEHSEASRAMMAAAAIPVVEIMDVDGEPVDAMVGISHVEAGRRMAAELAARGYRRIGFLGSKMPGDHRARKRLLGFEQGLAEAGLALADREFYSGGSGLATGREMTRRILERSPDLDCLYYSSDMNAGGGLMHCIAEGIPVPERIGIAGFNGLSLIDGLPVPLATMDARRHDIGRIAAEIILARLSGAPLPEEQVVLQATFREGKSLRPRPR